jgi:hypothetical protein
MRAGAAIVAGIAAFLLSAGPVLAQTPDPAAPPPAAAPPPRPAPRARPALRAPRRAVFTPRNKRAPEVMPPEGTPIVSSPEFVRLEDGKTRFWVEVSSNVAVVESGATAGSLRRVYRLRGAGVAPHNSQLALPIGVFGTPIERVQLVPQGADVDLIVELREPAELVYRVVETPRGIVLQIDVPRSQIASRDDDASEKTRPRATRSSASRSLGSAPPPDEAPRSMDDN